MPTSVSSRPTSRTTMTVEKPTGRFRDKTKEAAVARTIYLEIFFGGCITTILIFFPVFSIFWGSLWRTPAHNLQGWVIDFDGAAIGQGVVEALATPPPGARITWTPVLASQFPGGPHDVGLQILDQKSWLALTINPGTTARLTASIASPNASYNGADAITVFATEARNENAFRSIIRPSIQITMDVLSNTIAVQTARQVANSPNIAQLLTVSPQTVTAPISYRIRNMAPFDQPVAAAVTFIGLLYQLILSFFVVMNSHGAREASGLDKTLSTRSLIKLGFVSSFFAYFIISLFYSLLSLAFRLNVNRKFGHSGFMIFWMLNYVAMLSVGLALESLITILTPKFISSFMMMWIIVNVSISVSSIEVMPKIYHYGYAMPFYNVSHGMRTIIFGTKNVLGFTFGVLFVWIAISCITLPLIQTWSAGDNTGIQRRCRLYLVRTLLGRTRYLHA